MAINPVQGTEIFLKVETVTPGVFVEMYGSNSYSRTSTRNSTTTPLFMINNSVRSIGPLNESVQVDGVVDPADAGFNRLIELHEAKELANIQFLFDGINGYQQKCFITAFNTAVEVEGMMTFSITFEAQEDALQVGAGPVV